MLMRDSKHVYTCISSPVQWITGLLLCTFEPWKRFRPLFRERKSNTDLLILKPKPQTLKIKASTPKNKVSICVYFYNASRI